MVLNYIFTKIFLAFLCTLLLLTDVQGSSYDLKMNRQQRNQQAKHLQRQSERSTSFNFRPEIKIGDPTSQMLMGMMLLSIMVAPTDAHTSDSVPSSHGPRQETSPAEFQIHNSTSTSFKAPSESFYSTALPVGRDFKAIPEIEMITLPSKGKKVAAKNRKQIPSPRKKNSLDAGKTRVKSRSRESKTASPTSSSGSTDSILDITPLEETKIGFLTNFLFDSKPSSSENRRQKDLYDRLTHVRKGTADRRVERTDLATYLVLMSQLQGITSPEESLDQKAAFHRAYALRSMGDLATNSLEKRHFYHEAYYLYTRLSNMGDQPSIRKMATKNVCALLRTKKIKQRERLPLNDAIIPSVDTLTSMLSSEMENQEENFISDIFKEMGLELDPDMYEILKNSPAFKREKEKAIQEAALSMDGDTPGISEKKVAATKSIPLIPFKEAHINTMAHLLGQLYVSVKETPFLREHIPVVVPIGRSVSWLVKLHEILDPTLKTDIEFKHILASGLNNLKPTEVQKTGYKVYLDSLGFDVLDDDHHEIIFLDVSESGQTLISMKALIEELYPRLVGHTQHLAILYGEETTDLPCARIVYMPDGLRPVMFAKHEEKQHYCPHPTFYPHDWETPEILNEFVVPRGALEWEKKIQQWAEGKSAKRIRREIRENLDQ